MLGHRTLQRTIRHTRGTTRIEVTIRITTTHLNALPAEVLQRYFGALP